MYQRCLLVRSHTISRPQPITRWISAARVRFLPLLSSGSATAHHQRSSCPPLNSSFHFCGSLIRATRGLSPTTAAAAVGLGSDVRERPRIYSSFSCRLGTCGACACGRIRIHLGNSGWLPPEPAFKLSLCLEIFSLLIVQILGSIGFRISYAQIKYFKTMKW